MLFRLQVWKAVPGWETEALRVALTAALERGDSGVYELDDGYIRNRSWPGRWLVSTGAR